RTVVSESPPNSVFPPGSVIALESQLPGARIAGVEDLDADLGELLSERVRLGEVLRLAGIGARGDLCVDALLVEAAQTEATLLRALPERFRVRLHETERRRRVAERITRRGCELAYRLVCGRILLVLRRLHHDLVRRLAELGEDRERRGRVEILV